MNRSSQFVPWDSQSHDVWAARYAQGKIATIDDMQTHYLVRGEGRNIILIHGFFFDSTCWLQNIEALALHYRVYAIDLWGFGYSTRQPNDYSYQLFSRQLQVFMDRFDINSAILVGQSLGGGIAVRFAVEHPERVSQMILVAAAGLPNPEPISARMFMLPGVGESLLRFPVDFIRRRMMDDFFLYDPGVVTSEQFQELVWSQKISGSIASALSIMRGRFADKLESSIKRLAKMAIPTLIVWGENDRAITSTTGLKLHAHLPGSEFVLLKSAGHAPNLEQSREFNRVLLEFLLRT